MKLLVRRNEKKELDTVEVTEGYISQEDIEEFRELAHDIIRADCDLFAMGFWKKEERRYTTFGDPFHITTWHHPKWWSHFQIIDRTFRGQERLYIIYATRDPEEAMVGSSI